MRAFGVMIVLIAAACGGDDGGGGGATHDAASATLDAADHTAVCDSFCALMARCNYEAPDMWDSCSAARESACLAATSSCATALAAFNDCGEPLSCSNIPTSCATQMDAVDSACQW